MTHPLTPREKVARAIQAHDNDHVPDGYANGLSDEVSDWSAYLADRVLTALASGSGDHAELILMANAALEIYSDDVLVVGGTRRIHADNIILYVKNGVDALLAEVAALRGENDRLAFETDDATLAALQSRATEAERKLAEADRKIEDLTSALRSLAEGNLGDMSWQANYETIRQVARNAISKEAERG